MKHLIYKYENLDNLVWQRGSGKILNREVRPPSSEAQAKKTDRERG